MCRPDTGVQRLAVFHQQHQHQKHEQQHTQQQRFSRSNTWWKKSLAIRTVAFVDAEVEKLMSNSRFLRRREQQQQERQQGSTIASFRRREIEIGEFLGRGAFSEVYQVKSFHIDEDSSSQHDDNDGDDDDQVQVGLRRLLQQTCLDTMTGNCQYVVKHLRSDLLVNRTKFHSAAADFVLEAKFLSCMDHPNIIKLRALAVGGTSSFGDGKNDGYFLVLDHLDDTLSHQIQRWISEEQHYPSKVGGLSIRHYAEKVRYASQIASALDYLHQRDIMYRDLKPDNVGIKNGTIQLFDFGLCRELPEEMPDKNSNSVFKMSGCGTRRYMAPEVALNRPYNLKADVYSFSIVLHEMMSLQKPYEMYNSEVHQYLVCEGGKRPEIDVNWPKQLQDLLRSSWAPSPSDRPSMEQLCDQLERMASPGGNKTFKLEYKPSLFGLRSTHRAISNFLEAFKTSIVDMTSTTTLSISLSDASAVKTTDD